MAASILVSWNSYVRAVGATTGLRLVRLDGTDPAYSVEYQTTDALGNNAWVPLTSLDTTSADARKTAALTQEQLAALLDEAL